MRFEQDELNDIALYHGWRTVVQHLDGALSYEAELNGKWDTVTWTHVIEALQL
jgi:hypothetical protein